jgi:FAD-linked sulfhydryl oxidase
MAEAKTDPVCEERVCSSAKSAFAAMMRGKKKSAGADDAARGSTQVTMPHEEVSSEECPEDRESLGRSSWSILHTMAAHYPKAPNEQRREDVRQFLHLFSVLYPCTHCAEDFQLWMAAHPPDTSSRVSLSEWMCKGKSSLRHAG